MTLGWQRRAWMAEVDLECRLWHAYVYAMNKQTGAGKVTFQDGSVFFNPEPTAWGLNQALVHLAASAS